MPTKLTEKMCERLKAGPGGRTVWDAKATGLGFRVTPNDKRVWLMQLKFPPQRSQARRVMGHYPTMGLKAAREEAARWYSLVKSGIDPADVAAEKRLADQKARQAAALQNKQTFAAVAESYIEGRTNRRKAADALEIRRMLIAGAWGPRPIHSITPRDVRELFSKLVRRVPYDAKNCWIHASAIFRAAVSAELIAVSPLASVDRKQLFPKGTIKARQRALTNEELRAFWAGTETLGSPYREIFRLLTLTGCRLNEIAQMRWGELDAGLRKALRDARAGTPINWSALPDDIKVLRIPAERFKSDRGHIIQLSADACAIVEQIGRGARRNSGDYVFSITAGSKPINGISKAKERLDAAMLNYLRDEATARGEDPSEVRLERWVNHDLRRVVRSGLAALKVPFEVAELCLGHALGGLHATYNVHGYEPEQRAALEQWAAKLRTITTPPPAPTADNVVNMPRKRAS